MLGKKKRWENWVSKRKERQSKEKKREIVDLDRTQNDSD